MPSLNFKSATGRVVDPTTHDKVIPTATGEGQLATRQYRRENPFQMPVAEKLFAREPVTKSSNR
jgi:hypothetical protein